MKIGIILPDSDIDLKHLDKIKNLVKQYFKNSNQIILYALDTSVNYYESLNLNIVKLKPFIETFTDNKFFNDVEALVVMRDKHDKNPSFTWKLELPVYKAIMFGYGGLRQVSGENNISSDRSIFHNMAQEGYTYFPYTFLHPRNMFNDENSLGFRMTEDISYLENRDESHIVIAIFGGSAAYDIININSFSSQIEMQLNTKYKDKEVTVLNFGLCGGLILNEMILYMLFAWKINPDIVISYSGFNDLLMGQFSDTTLQKDYNIAYSHIYRNWASQLYNTDNEETFKTTTPSDIVIKSYYEREKEFEDIITNRAKKFISILQPMIYSKEQLSENEKFYSKINTFKGMDLALHNMKVLYEKYLVYLSDNEPCKYYLNLHNEFKQYGDQYTFFADTVHTMPEGSNAIANHISKYLKGVIDD